MNIKAKKIRQLIREALRSDREDKAKGDPTKIAYGRPFEERLEAMMHLVRLVFEVGMSQNSTISTDDPEIVRAIIESPDSWVLHVPVESLEGNYNENYLQNNPDVGREVLIHYVSSLMTLPVWAEYDPERQQAMSEDYDAVEVIDNIYERVAVVKMPSEEFIKDRASYIISLPGESFGWIDNLEPYIWLPI